MAYLGNKPVNNFVSFAKQDITGNGGTSYSLDYPVTNANDIELFINNVRQEPTEAYSCSGSTLTLTEAVASTDDVYVIFRGRALQTVTHPSQSPLNATTGTFSGAVNVGGNIGVGGVDPSTLPVFIQHGIEVSNGAGVGIHSANSGDNRWIFFGHGTANLDVQQAGIVNQGSDQSLALTTGATQRVRIDSAGRVTMPYQPMVHAARNAGNVSGSGQVFIFNRVDINVGNHYNSSTGVFTAPIAGNYYVNFYMLAQSNDNFDINIRKNNSRYSECDFRCNNGAVASNFTLSGSALVSLSASDTCDIYVAADTAGIYGSGLSGLQIMLVG